MSLISRWENLGSWWFNQGHRVRVRSGTRYPNLKSSFHSVTSWNFSQLLPNCSRLPCIPIFLPGKQDDADRHGPMGLWSSGWMRTYCVGELTGEAFFLPFLFCPSRLNQTLSPGNYASFSNMMFHHPSYLTYSLSSCLRSSDLYLAFLFFINEGEQCDVVERTVRWERRNVVSSFGIDTRQ